MPFSRFAQAIDVANEQIAGAVGERQREKEGAAFNAETPVAWHERMIACWKRVGTALRAFAHPTSQSWGGHVPVYGATALPPRQIATRSFCSTGSSE